MNTIKYISILFFCILCSACEKVQIPDASEFDLTEIVAFKAYDMDKTDIATNNPIIDTKSGTVTIPIKKETNLKAIFATCGLSSGATISPALNSYEDWSALTKTFTVTSASGKRSQQWTIKFQH